MAENTTNNTIATAELTPAVRFTNSVMKHYKSNAGSIEMTEFQKQLVQGYFVAIDRVLAATEEERLRKNANNKDHKYDNTVPCTWQNIDIEQLALDVVHYSKMGLDMMQENHLFAIPYKNNKKGVYDMTLMIGYSGKELIAKKYALEPPAAVTVELVYSTDTFIPIKKGEGQTVESYEFKINNPFDRGEILGGFGYIEYDDPAKNRLIIMTKAQIEKRKPKYASANFWGGIATGYENGKKVETQVDGWYDEMCLKTLKREIYSSKHIVRDPAKIDSAYRHMKVREAQVAEIEAEAEIAANANTIVIDTVTEPTPQQPKPTPQVPQPTYAEPTPAADEMPNF